MKGLNVFGFAEDFCGLVVCVQKIQEDRKDELKYYSRDIKLIAMDKKFYKKIYEIRLFNDQVYKNVRKGDFVVFRNSLIFKKKGKKIKLEFLRNESLLLIGDKEIQNVKGLQYWKELDRNRRIYKLDKNYKQNFVI